MRNFEIIDEQAATRGQSHYFTGLYAHAGHKVRVRVRCDTYPQQSYALVEVLTAAGWVELATLLDPASRNTRPWDGATVTDAAERDTAVLLARAEVLLPLPTA